MKKIAVSAVSYTNTLPFLNGIRNSADVMNAIDLSVDYPRECGRKVKEHEADLGIIPVAVLATLPEYHIISDYCIGSDGAVNSVFIFSDKPIEDIDTLRLDPQSRTSNGLARILLKHYWKKNIEVVEEGDADAYVLIGDRSFGKNYEVPYAYDLGHYWKELTGLPFAYAVWVSTRELPQDFQDDFNQALAAGTADPEAVIPGLAPYKNFDYPEYLTQYLDFHLTADKRKAIDTYLELYKQL